ncbi:MAG: hypothetical protein R2731_01375 [Nocardioides sp.]
MPVRDEAPPRRAERELRAIQLVLPAGSGFTHVTAAWILGWWMPILPDLLPVFAAGPGIARPRRAGLVFSRLPTMAPVSLSRGLPIVAPAEAILRAARDLALLDLVPMLESALRAGDVDPDALDAVTASPRPGVRALREARSWVDTRSESAPETLLRLFHAFADIDVEPQHPIHDTGGRLIARGDLLVVGTHMVHEYDGEGHGTPRQRAADLRRERRLLELGYTRRGFVLEDLVGRSAVTLQELDRAMRRPHRPGRLAWWRRELGLSSYTRAGRQRLLNRWLTRSGYTDWARTA